MTVHKSNFKKTSKEILLDLINHENGSNLLARTTSFDAPQPKINRFVTTVIRGSPEVDNIFGEVGLTYKRVYLQELYSLEMWPTKLTIWDKSYMHVLDAFNRKYGVNLGFEDLTINGQEITDSFELEEGKNAFFVFKAKPTSLIWAGECTVEVYMSGEPFVDRPEGAVVAITEKTDIRVTASNAIRVFII